MVATITSSLGQLGSIRVILALAAVFGMLTAQAGRGTLAYFTDVATSSGNTFAAGSIDLNLTGGTSAGSGNVTATFTASNTAWKPGQVQTAPITVANAGTLPLTYGITYTAADSGNQPDSLGSATPTQFHTITIKGAGTGTASDCTDANFSNATLWSSTPVNAVTLSTAGATLLADTSRSLAASGSEVLCTQIAFTNGASAAENAAMGGTMTLGLSFNSRQT
jgi:predicted ribosomally synthesized peptide with SipW-like signal peptide